MTDTTHDPFADASGAAADSAAAARDPSTRSLSLHKIALIAGLAIATILPNLFMTNLIEERESRQAGVRDEFKRNWGPEQSLYSPMLIIPFQAGALAAPIPQDRADAARPCRHADAAGAQARPVPGDGV